MGLDFMFIPVLKQIITRLAAVSQQCSTLGKIIAIFKLDYCFHNRSCKWIFIFPLSFLFTWK